MIPKIERDGAITIRSIFEMTEGHSQISSFLYECAAQNCTVTFANEGITIAPGDMGDIGTRAMISTYGMLIAYPKAARDYCNYIFSITDKK